MALQTYGTLTDEQRTNYKMVLLKRMLPRLTMFDEGMKGSIPRNGGMVSQWRSFASLALATTALTEGTTPAETGLSLSVVSATVLQYGAWVKASDLLVHQGIDPVWTEMFALLGEQAGQSLHTVHMNVLAGGTNVWGLAA